MGSGSGYGRHLGHQEGHHHSQPEKTESQAAHQEGLCLQTQAKTKAAVCGQHPGQGHIPSSPVRPHPHPGETGASPSSAHGRPTGPGQMHSHSPPVALWCPGASHQATMQAGNRVATALAPTPRRPPEAPGGLGEGSKNPRPSKAEGKVDQGTWPHGSPTVGAPEPGMGHPTPTAMGGPTRPHMAI